MKIKASIGAGIYVVYWGNYLSFSEDPNSSPLIYNNLIYDNYFEDKGAGIEVWTVGTNELLQLPLNLY